MAKATALLIGPAHAVRRDSSESLQRLHRSAPFLVLGRRYVYCLPQVCSQLEIGASEFRSERMFQGPQRK